MSGVCQHVNVGRSQEREDERKGERGGKRGGKRGGVKERRGEERGGRRIGGKIKRPFFLSLLGSTKVPSALFLKHLCAAYPIFTSSLKDKRLTFSLVSLVHKITCITLSRIEP